MLGALIVVGVLGCAATAALAAIAARSQLAPGPSLADKTIVVHTKRPDDKTIKGILHAQYADRWVLREAVVVTPLGEQPAGGVVHISVHNIAFAQEIGLPRAPAAAKEG